MELWNVKILYYMYQFAYVDLFCSWSELKYLDVHKVKNIENVIIWYE